MGIMVFTLISTYLLCLIGRGLQNQHKKINGVIFILLATIILIGIAGLRTNIGDTYVYISGYKNFQGQTFLEAIDKKGDLGFYAFTYVLYKISENPQFMIFIVAFITQVLYLKFFLKYESYIELELFIYIASGFYFVTMNGMRQSLAAGFVALSIKYIIDNKIGKFLVIIVLTSMIHESALIMIPIYFICKSKPWSKVFFLLVGIALIGTMLFYELLPVLDKVLQGSNYQHYIEVFLEGQEEGANAIRLAVSIVPVLLAYINRRNMEDTSFNRVFINMSLINAIFMLFSVKTWIFARFSIYFNMFNYILIPLMIKEWPNKQEKKVLYRLLLLCYLIFFIREQIFAERINFIRFWV